MYKALIIEENSVTILDVIYWNNCGKDYIKLISDLGTVLMCSSSNLRLFIRDDKFTDEELVKNVVNREVSIKYYENGVSRKLDK